MIAEIGQQRFVVMSPKWNELSERTSSDFLYRGPAAGATGSVRREGGFHCSLSPPTGPDGLRRINCRTQVGRTFSDGSPACPTQNNAQIP